MQDKNKELQELDKLDEGLNKETTVSISGWHDVKREHLPFEGNLFPANYRFQVKAADAGTVAHYSAMDETNPLSVQAALTNVIEKHIRVLDASDKQVNVLEVVQEYMRFWFVMLVHTYTGSTTSLTHKENCQHCKKSQNVTITPYNITFDELTEFTKRYLDTTTGKILVKTKNFGNIEYQPITLAMRAELLSFMQERMAKKEEFDLQFLAYASMIFPLRTDKQPIESLYLNVYFPMTQNIKKFSAFTKIKNEITFSQSMEILHTCTSCKKDCRLDISNTRGLSSIFLDADTDSEFL